jgi:hypothetical protein
MLSLDKHSNLTVSVVNVGGLIIRILKDKQILPFDELLALLVEEVGDEVKEVYLAALSFLFLIGKVKYYQDIDSLEFSG